MTLPARASCSPRGPARWGTAAAGAAGCDPIYVTSFVVAGATVRALLAEDPLPERGYHPGHGRPGREPLRRGRAVRPVPPQPDRGAKSGSRSPPQAPSWPAARRRSSLTTRSRSSTPRDVGLALEVDRYPFAMRGNPGGRAAGSEGALIESRSLVEARRVVLFRSRHARLRH